MREQISDSMISDARRFAASHRFTVEREREREATTQGKVKESQVKEQMSLLKLV